MRVVVVGAGGYIGGVVLDYLVAKGHDAVGVLRNPAGHAYRSNAGLATMVFLDVTREDFPDKIEELVPDVIVYCISLDHSESEMSVLKSLAVNVAPLAELARHLAIVNPMCPIIYLSTLQVYGPLGSGEKIDEKSPVRPKNLYAATHLFCEELLGMYGATLNLTSVALRLSNSFGAPAFSNSKSDWLVVNDFCRSSVRVKEIAVKSDGSAVRDFIFVDDVAIAVERLCVKSRDLDGFHIFNLAAGESMSLSSVAEVVRKAAAATLGIDIVVRRSGTSQTIATNSNPFTVSTASLQETIGELTLSSFEEGVIANLRHFVEQIEKDLT